MSTKSYIRNHLGVAWGLVQHHIWVLERAEIIASLRVGSRQRFFLSFEKPPDADGVALLRTPRLRELASFIAGHPGAVQSEITQGIGMHRTVLRTYMDRLVAAGLVDEVRNGRFQVYHATPRLEPALTPQAEELTADILGYDEDGLAPHK